jgi:hypothetical protein
MGLNSHSFFVLFSISLHSREIEGYLVGSQSSGSLLCKYYFFLESVRHLVSLVCLGVQGSCAAASLDKTCMRV